MNRIYQIYNLCFDISALEDAIAVERDAEKRRELIKQLDNKLSILDILKEACS